MQVAAGPFSTHYHSYYQFQSSGTHHHDLKRQYLSLLPSKQIIEICLTFDAYVPPYAKTTIWPLDLNAAIAALQKIAPSSVNDLSKSTADPTNPPNAQESCAAESEGSKSGEPPPADEQISSPESSTVPQPLSPNPLGSMTSADVEPHQTLTVSAPATQVQLTQSPTPAPPYPFGYGHPQIAYPHAPYYTSGYPYPYSYPAPVQNGLQPSLAPSPFSSHHAPYGGAPPPEASGNDDLPSYEEMIVEALTECTDPDGWVPKDLFTWMAGRYPLQSNFRPSASQALQKAFKRGRFEKNGNGKYRLSSSWEGGSTSRRTTRRPQTQNASSSSANRAPVSPFTHAPLVHHHHPSQVVGPPYPMPPHGYPAYVHQLPTSTSNAPGIEPSTERDTTTTAVGDSAAAYEAAQSILKAINFGGLLKIPPEDEESKKEGSSQPSPHTVGNGVEHLLSHVQAVLASRNSAEAATTRSGPLPDIATPSVLPSSTVHSPENNRAELQAQLALLSAQLAELVQLEESQVTKDPTASVGSFSGPPMNSLIPDEPSSLPQPLDAVGKDIPPNPLTLQSAAVEPAGIVAASAEESDDDDMEEVI